MRETSLAVPDPRTFPDPASAPAAMRELHALAEASLAAESGQRSDAINRDLRAALARRLESGGAELAMALDGAPSVAVARHLWRTLDAVWRDAPLADGAAVAVTVFALPVVVVTGTADVHTEVALTGVIGRPEKLAGILGEYGALKGNRTFVLANALVAAEAIDVARMPEIRAWTRLPDALAPGTNLPPRVLLPAPLAVHSGSEGVHLRFLVGSAIAKPGVDLLADTAVGKWGIPFARELAKELGGDGVSVLTLPRTPQRLMPAVSTGRAAQREVSVQLFASNAIRRFRGSVGEPAAVISAHRAPDSPGGGELRLSLSSPFDPRAAEGFRCPLYPLDRVGDVVSMLVDLVRDCKVTDIRALAGVHSDRVAGSGLPMLFKPDTIPDGAQVTSH